MKCFFMALAATLLSFSGLSADDASLELVTPSAKSPIMEIPPQDFQPSPTVKPYRSYGYFLFGTASSILTGIRWDNNPSSHLAPSHLGVGRRFLFGDHSGTLIEMNGSMQPKYFSACGFKIGYNYRFLGDMDTSTPYIGLSQHMGVLRLNNGYRDRLSKELRAERGGSFPSYIPYFTPEVSFGYEYKKADQSPIFLELVAKIITPGVSVNMGFGF